MIEIIPLMSCQQVIPELAQMWYELLGLKWAPGVKVSDVEQRFLNHCNDEKLPLTLVAFKNQQPIGMCSLRENEGIRPELSPWLGSLVVDKHFQNQGIAKLLIDAIKEKAKQKGFSKLYLFTFDKTLPEYYQRLNWEILGIDEFQAKPVTVMECVL